MKKSELRKLIREEIYKYKVLNEAKTMNELRVVGREEYEDVRYHVMHHPPQGYFIKGADAEGRKIFGKVKPKYFDKYDDAIEHAELEIDGYLK